MFTEGDHDDGTAWATTGVDTADLDADALRASIQAWSPSESFNTLRHLVVYVGPKPPGDEGSFPDPGQNSTGITGTEFGGLREPLHQREGWLEYAATWTPQRLLGTVYLAVGVTVVWETDATHYLDRVRLETA